MERVLTRCSKEDINTPVTPEPLYADNDNGVIKCQWCPTWKGAQQTKVVNQHTNKAVSHATARQKILGISTATELETGVQLDIRSFLIR